MTDCARLVYCRCAYAKVVPDSVKDEVLRQLTLRGATFEAVADLCELSAKRDPALQSLVAGGPVRIAACYPRAVKWLFHAAGAPLPDEGVEVVNMRTATAEDAVTAMLAPAKVEAAP